MLLPATLAACVPPQRFKECFGGSWLSAEIVIAAIGRQLNLALEPDRKVDKKDEIIAMCVEALLFNLAKYEESHERFNKVNKVITTISLALERNPKCLKTEQYKAIIKAVTPPSDPEEQRKFSSQLTKLYGRHRSTDRDRFRKTTVALCKASMEALPAYEAYWLYCIPMIHFLSGLRPFEVITFDVKKPEWGDQGIQDIIERTVQKLSSVSHFPFWENHICFFNLDTMLPMTLAACVPPLRFSACFIDTNWVSPDLVLAAGIRHLYQTSTLNSQFEKQLRQLLIHLTKALAKENDEVSISQTPTSTSSKENTATQCRIATEQLCDLLHQLGSHSESLVDSIILVIVAIQEEWRAQHVHHSTVSSQERNKAFTKVKSIAKQLFQQCNGTLKLLVKTADRLLNPKEISESTGRSKTMKAWKTSVCNQFRQHASKVEINTIFNYYCGGTEKLPKEVDEIFRDILEERLEEAFNQQTDGFWKGGSAFLKVYSNFLENKRRLAAGCILYRSALEWHILLPGLKMLAKSKNLGLSEEAGRFLEEVKIAFTTLIEDITTDDITARDLHFVRDNQRSFEMFVKALGYSYSSIDKTIRTSCESVAELKVTCQRLSQFIESSKEEIEEAVLIKDCIAISNNDTKTVRYIKETRDSLSTILVISLEELEQISRCMESVSFRKIWIAKRSHVANGERLVESGERRDSSVISLSDLIYNVWKPSFKDWSVFGRQIKDLSITLEEITAATGIEVRDKKELTDRLRKELVILDNELKNLHLSEVSERVLAACNDVFDIQQSVRISEAIKKIKDTYRLTGNFSKIDNIMKVEKGGIALREVNRETVELSKTLASFSYEMLDCMESFIESRDVVEWILVNMKGGQNDIKMFVDLALMAVGESDLDIAVVRCFHSAALGYSRLILIPRNCPLTDFIVRLTDVNNAFKNDPRLHKKLRETLRDLQKLKSIHGQQHEASDKKSLEQAKQIIKFGTCHVGSDNVNGVTEMVLPQIINMEVEQRGEVVTFPYETLEDIQNRLMLAGSSEDLKDPNAKDAMTKEDIIDKFTMIFDSLRRLGLVYIHLNKLGCILFSQMKVVISGGDDTNSDMCQISLGGKVVLTVVRQEDETSDITQNIKAQAKLFEKCLEEWGSQIKKARKKFYFLNHFTTTQLILIQKKIDASRSKKQEKQLRTLLSLVLPGCTTEQMEDAMGRMSNYGIPGKGNLTTKDTVLKLLTTMFEEANKQVTNLERTYSMKQMVQVFDVVWKAFVEEFSKKESTSNSLSFRGLGRILFDLVEKVPKQDRLHRSLPELLKTDEPNLIVCPARDIVNATLTVYLMDRNKVKPLPRPEEILSCTCDTTIDEVEVFLRRSVQQHPMHEKKIYCMMHADQLTIEVACAAENILKKLQRKHKHDFHLVVLSSKENENRSVMTAALEKYRRKFPESPVEVIKDYASSELGNAVEVVTSKRAGEGKTLHKNKRFRSGKTTCSIPMYDRVVDREQVMSMLPSCTTTGESRYIHIDIAPVVQSGVDYVLFQLLIVGCLASRSGDVWLMSRHDLFLVECLESSIIQTIGKESVVHKTLCILPTTYCISPLEWLYSTTEGTHGFCRNEYQTKTFKVPYDHLRKNSEKSMKDCIDTLLSNCGVQDPSWAELKQFASFLNVQLTAFTKSIFCSEAVAPDLPGFSDFVKIFMVQMSQDFATRSLDMSEETDGHTEQQLNMQNDLQRFQMKRKWETSPHPYLFFNEDQTTITFLGFNLKKSENGWFDLIDDQTDNVLASGIMNQELFDALNRQGVPLSEQIEHLTRSQRLQKLALVMGLKDVRDPDTSYELTPDNMKKILAVYMRFKCSIPVIIMGETGCGKTSLVKFMCQLQCPDDGVRNMILMKVHGGTTKSDIMEIVHTSDRLAKKNVEQYGSAFFTVLFFDEANTTEAINFIKEIMCDNTMNGEKLELTANLKFIAACNPYRKHSADMIERLEKAGLGYHVKLDETTDKLGRIPMRHLVYRVQPLPHSMLPMVWDFGQLNLEMERQYIKQMVAKQIPSLGRCKSSIAVRHINALSQSKREDEDVASILLASQSYMRKQKDECSFVSLRDVQRTLQVMSWFLGQEQETLLDAVNEKMKTFDDILPKTRSLVLALGVCYLSALKDKDKYTKFISRRFGKNCPLPGGAERFEQEIRTNQALSENVFLMTVCIELRIPLFLVGKPGSSKSLAKAILTDTMQGASSKTDLFKIFKQAQMLSYQCSPLSTSDGIILTFKQAAGLQETQDLQKFVSVVVLDEIGLAEDSPHMPLKALHPLLEDGSDKDALPETPQPFKKVSFIGISNWALDPAKMNRGILVQRNVPSEKELIESARGICDTDESVQNKMEEFLTKVATAYMELTKIDFFGLRDFYGLIKMMYAFIATSKKKLTNAEWKHSILRNFGGHDDLNALEIFRQHVQFRDTKPDNSDPDCTQLGLIKAALAFKEAVDGLENRYLLLLTENYSFLPMLQHQILTIKNLQLTTLFGSSFPKDQEYTQICRNINRIKLCMESGQAVLLLNLENLYESLYDVLNQYYVHYAGEQYVDLGLGTNRMKCKVHPNFRLILVAEKQTVYNTFPIPLINRLEKHLVRGEMLLTDEQFQLSRELDDWMHNFIQNGKYPDVSKADVFIGYSTDMAPLTALKVWGERIKGDRVPKEDTMTRIKDECKSVLLKACTPDGMIRLPVQAGQNKATEHQDEYFSGMHDSIICLLESVNLMTMTSDTFIQVTTYSQLLPAATSDDICNRFKLHEFQVEILNAKAFETDQEFCKKIREFISSREFEPETKQKVLILQCDSGDQNSNLIACARHRIQDVIQDPTIHKEFTICVLLVIQLPNVKGGCFTGFQSGQWMSVHIDDINQETRRRDLRRICQMTYTELLQKSTDSGQQQQTTIDIPQVLKNCVCISMAKIRGPDQKISKRGLKRISHLMDLMHSSNVEADNQETMTFANGIVKVLRRLQTEKEEKSAAILGQTPKIARNACEPEHVRRSGTFRRSVTRCIEMEISTSLTYATSFMDTNQNLDLLKCSYNLDKKVSWKDIFFLKVLNNDENMIMQYKVMQGTLKSDEKDSNFVVEKTTGYDDQPFQARLPFSWIIYSNIDRIYRRIAADKQVFSTAEVAKIVSSSLSVMKDLDGSISSMAEREEAAKLYLHDFIHMSFPCDNVNVRQVLESTFHQAGIETGNDVYAGQISLSFVNIHHIKTVVNKRLEDFQMLRKVWPHCDVYVKKNIKPFKDEVVLDVLALQGAVHDICSSFTHAEKTIWVSRVEKCALLITSILKKEGHTKYGKACTEMLTSIRNEWGRLLVLKMFYEEVISKMSIDFDMDRVLASLKICSLKEKSGIENLNEFIREWRDAAAGAKRETTETFEKYLDSFYMRVVSQLCFEDNSPPSDAVIKKLLTHMTSGIAGSASKKSIAKSFLLQLLLRSSGDSVKRHIETFFGDMGTSLKNRLQTFFAGTNTRPDSTRLLEFCSMVVKCIEDSYRSRLLENNPSFAEEVAEALSKLKWACQQKFQTGLHYGNLETIASIQFGLKMTSTCLQKCFVAKTEKMSDDVMGLLEKARTICTDRQMQYPHKFLIRDFCDKYGGSSYQTLVLAVAESQLQWVDLYSTSKENPPCDNRYRVCGPDYVDVQNKMKTTLLQILKDKDNPQTSLSTNTQMQIVHFALALHREVTFSYLQDSGLFQPEIKRRITEVVQRNVSANSQIMAHMSDLVNNETGKSMTYLNIREGLDLHHQGIICLLEHLYVLCLVFRNSDSLLSPLIKVALEPDKMQKAYLPTMPQGVDYQKMLMEIRRIDIYATFNVCPNGHPYIIANCGRPVSTLTCADCGLAIGGIGYKFKDGNRKLDESELIANPTKDQGHLLGDLKCRSASSVVRDLTPVSSSILRLFTHASLLLGANSNSQAVLSMIKPPIAVGELQTFLVGHLRRDLDDLHRNLDRSDDDILLICHYTLDLIARRCINASLKGNNCSLCSSEARSTWESNIQMKVVIHITKDSRQILKDCHEHMKGDTNVSGSSIQLVTLLETDFGKDKNPTLDKAQESCILWKRHGRVSVEGFVADVLSNNVTETQDKRTLLENFIAKLDMIELVRYLPDILDLQRTLLRMFKRNMDRVEAGKTSIKQFLTDLNVQLNDSDMERVNKQILICSEVWEKMQEYLKNYGLAIEKKGFTIKRIVPAAIRTSPITPESPVEMLLPSFDGQGLCAFVLAEFLIRTQNDFLQEYCRIFEFRLEDIPLVLPKDVSRANVITVDKNVHLLPLILSNCKYEIDAEKGQRFEYDKDGIERQLTDRFISGRSRIAIKSIPTMMYRSETAETWSYRHLTEVIPQVPMTETLKKKVLDDFHSLPQLYQALDNLDMTISLLCCLPEQTDNPDRSLFDFMTKTLRMSDTELGQQVELSCRFKHVPSLWLALSMKKDDLLLQSHQDAFQCLEMKYKTTKIDDNMKKKYQDFFCPLTKAKQRQLIETLYECIVIRFPNDETDDEQIDYTSVSVFNILYGHMSAPIYDETQLRNAGITLLDEDDEDILNFPPEIQGTMAVSAWGVAMEWFQSDK
ncbi:E3 ubiquitin-protein ligase rnf213-alpha-like isoform X2 [Argopecten irradians]|uniref:E3 ubiquitin-protein ligase rnf213-alpha-like isoform X2 n=1 Tax=Argopecten irradians TaxID=31199 RepID=UPI00371C062E